MDSLSLYKYRNKPFFQTNSYSVHKMNEGDAYFGDKGYNYNYIRHSKNSQKKQEKVKSDVQNRITKPEYPISVSIPKEISGEEKKHSILSKTVTKDKPFRRRFAPKVLRYNNEIMKLKRFNRKGAEEKTKTSLLEEANKLKSTINTRFSRNLPLNRHISEERHSPKDSQMMRTVNYFSPVPSKMRVSMEKETVRLRKIAEKLSLGNVKRILDSPDLRVTKCNNMSKKMGERYDPLNFSTSNQINRVKRNYYGALFIH